MDEADEERDRVRVGVRGGGLNSGYKALFSACLQVLPSNREETDRGKRAGEHISLYLFHSFSFCSWPYTLPKSQHRHAHTHTQTKTLSLCLSPSYSVAHTHTHTHTNSKKPCPSLAVRMAAVLPSGRRRGKEGKERQKQRNELGRKSRHGGEKMQWNPPVEKTYHQGCCHSICCSDALSHPCVKACFCQVL